MLLPAAAMITTALVITQTMDAVTAEEVKSIPAGMALLVELKLISN